jgi:uncharacterized protein
MNYFFLLTDGEANTELLKFLSKSLNLRKSDLTLDRGSKSRHKTIVLSKGISSIDEVLELLRKECVTN